MSWTSRWAWIGALALLACEAQEAADADADAGACNGPSVWFGDADGDGQGDPLEVFAGCPPPAGYVDNSNDPDPACAGGVTDACGVCGGPGPRLWYRDADHDGLGDLIDGTVECAAPAGFVDNADDPEPACATNDTDPCGICAGAGGPMGYRDQDEDGLGDPEQAMVLCGPEPGFVLNDDDPEPECATNDTDDCGVCAGEGIRRYFADQDEDGRGDPEVWIDACARPLRFVESDDDPDPRCATDDTDDCGVCGGGGASKDCVGVCFGEARLDGCGRCAGGTTGRVPFVDDDNQNGVPDACDQCPATPTARAIIQWTDVPAFGPEGASGPYSFQVILYENGDFVFVYADIEPFEATPTVGHQGLAGHGAVSLGVDSDYAREHPVVFFHADDDGRVEVDYTLTADWLDVRAAGEALPFADANGEVEVPLDFQFPYDGARYDRVRVSANGVITLAGAAPGPQNGPMGDPALGAFLAPFWDDLDPASSGSVFVWQQPADCERDCAGQFGGVAVVDDCGVCVGGTSRADPHAHRDCDGACFGEARIDACGRCSGGDTGVAPADPALCGQAPDLIVDRNYLRSSLQVDHINANDPCLIQERCLGGLGQRKIVRFGTRIANVGNADLQLGRPEDDNPLWNFDQCHGHFHFLSYAAYDLYDPVSDRTLPVGAKSGFAVVDLGVYDPNIAVNGCRGYGGSNQGITAGCHDTYSRGLQCQWIDVTGVPDGEYDVVVTTNPDQIISELDYGNNSARVRIRLQGDRLDVLD